MDGKVYPEYRCCHAGRARSGEKCLSGSRRRRAGRGRRRPQAATRRRAGVLRAAVAVRRGNGGLRKRTQRSNRRGRIFRLCGKDGRVPECPDGVHARVAFDRWGREPDPLAKPRRRRALPRLYNPMLRLTLTCLLPYFEIIINCGGIWLGILEHDQKLVIEGFQLLEEGGGRNDALCARPYRRGIVDH